MLMKSKMRCFAMEQLLRLFAHSVLIRLAPYIEHTTIKDVRLASFDCCMQMHSFTTHQAPLTTGSVRLICLPVVNESAGTAPAPPVTIYTYLNPQLTPLLH